MQNKLFIISNESIYYDKENFFCDNLDMKSTPEGLNKFFEVNIIARKSKKKRSHVINLKNISTHNNIFGFISSIFDSFKKKNSKYFVVSLSPFTFLACVLLVIFRKNPIVFLRSDGYEEYKSILGFLGPAIYHVMFFCTSKISRFISCGEKNLKGKKGEVVYPSQLTDKWFLDIKDPELTKIKLLYVGRIKIEKGVFSLVEIMRNIGNKATLSAVGVEKNSGKKIDTENVKFFPIEIVEERLIKFYDDHSIFVLPSFTEGYPMVLLESLARRRPVIIFDEIVHVIDNKMGIFISKRNPKDFQNTINHIKNNYKKIQESMEKNILLTKQDFLEDLKDKIIKIY